MDPGESRLVGDRRSYNLVGKFATLSTSDSIFLSCDSVRPPLADCVPGPTVNLILTRYVSISYRLMYDCNRARRDTSTASGSCGSRAVTGQYYVIPKGRTLK